MCPLAPIVADQSGAARVTARVSPDLDPLTNVQGCESLNVSHRTQAGSCVDLRCLFGVRTIVSVSGAQGRWVEVNLSDRPEVNGTITLMNTCNHVSGWQVIHTG